MSFQSISQVTLVCWAVTSSGPNAEYIDIAQNVQDYIGCDELQESCLCLMSDADESAVRVLAYPPIATCGKPGASAQPQPQLEMYAQ